MKVISMTKQELIRLLEPIMVLLLSNHVEKWSLVGEPRWNPSFTSFSILISSPHRSRWLERNASVIKKALKGIVTSEDNYAISNLEFHNLKGSLTILDSSEPFGVFDAMLSVPEHTRSVVRGFLKKSRKQLQKKGIIPGVWPIDGYVFKKGNLYISGLTNDSHKLYVPSSQIFYEMFKCIPEVVHYRAAILNEEVCDVEM